MTQNFFYKQNTLPNLASEEKALPLPSHIGPYKIETLLNKGGMSLLYLGIHPETKQPLAIKILSPDYVSDEKAVERFLKEAHIISLSNHPNIVKLYGEGKWERGLYIAMEWIRGVSLRQFIMQQSLSLRRALDIVLQVAYALHHLHSHGVIHRDLKPENILITEEGSVKVIDFGIAQLHNEKLTAGPLAKQGILGTPNYMSPEQKEDASQTSFSSDIYSLGVISYELILGKLSFGVINLSLLPKELRKIISKALAISAKERYQTISEFISDISEYLKSGEIEKERPGSDQLKELLEIFQRVSQTLSPLSSPEWPPLEIGIAKYKLATQFGLYYDLFKLPNNSYFLLIAESASQGMETLIHIASLRGMVRTLMHQMSNPTAKIPFHSLSFVQALNDLVYEDTLKQLYAFNCLILDPLRDQLTFINAGMNDLIHLSQGGVPRTLLSHNPLLGQEAHPEFAEIIDNWNLGDTLVLHSLSSAFRTEPFQQKELERTLFEATLEEALLSAQPQAEALLKRGLSLPFLAQQKQSKVLLSIQRIS